MTSMFKLVNMALSPCNCQYFHDNYMSPYLFSASASLSTLARLVSRSVMPAGNCTAWSTASSLMARCPLTRPSEAVMTPSTPSSARPALASTCPVPCSSTWSPPSSVSTTKESKIRAGIGVEGDDFLEPTYIHYFLNIHF